MKRQKDTGESRQEKDESERDLRKRNEKKRTHKKGSLAYTWKYERAAERWNHQRRGRRLHMIRSIMYAHIGQDRSGGTSRRVAAMTYGGASSVEEYIGILAEAATKLFFFGNKYILMQYARLIEVPLLLLFKYQTLILTFLVVIINFTAFPSYLKILLYYIILCITYFQYSVHSRPKFKIKI